MTSPSSAAPAATPASHAVIAGTCGGIAVVLTGHPFDTMKTLAQNSTKSASVSETAAEIFKTHGFGGFYRGVGSPLTGQMFLRSVLFFSHNEAKKATANPFAAGALAGLAAATVEQPIDWLKTQHQVRKTETGSVFALGRRLIAQHGPQVVFQGGAATVIRNVPANAVYFSANELTKSALTARSGESSPSMAILLAAGGLAGFCYWSATYPLDAIKGALQGQDPANKRFRGWFHCASTLFREGGVKRFFRGITPCLMRSIPANAAMLTTVDRVKSKLAEF